MNENVKSAQMHIRVNPEVRDRAMEVLNEIGITVSDLVTMLLNQVAIQKRVPFDLLTDKYICAHGYLHDYSDFAPPNDDEYHVFGSWSEAKEWLNA
ncbi:MAG: type II toxin-antitoxin system RelB/DinJ family antitoxin [Oscillospiraceae bacterium]|nr:type II toxin-antitoxin system RelB/DinJ family antitoxin [Oscillospiraceae bacterium]